MKETHILHKRSEKLPSPEIVRAYIGRLIEKIVVEYHRQRTAELQRVINDPPTDLYPIPPVEQVSPEMILLLPDEKHQIAILPSTRVNRAYRGKSRANEILLSGKILYDGKEWDPFSAENFPFEILEIFATLIVPEREEAEHGFIEFIRLAFNFHGSYSGLSEKVLEEYQKSKREYAIKHQATLTKRFVSLLRSYLNGLERDNHQQAATRSPAP